MRTTNEVIQAVKDGTPCTEEELRYAVQNLSIWQNGLVFTLARAATEEPVSSRTKRECQRAYDNMRTGNQVPLDKRLKGGSFEPGIPVEERRRRSAESIAGAGERMFTALMDLADKEDGR